METISVGKESDVSSDGNVVYGGFNEGTNKQIRDLAREFTRQTSVGDGVQDSDDATDSNEVEKFGVDHASPNSPPKSNQYDLLRTLTSMSQVPGVNPVDQTIDPRLDPNSDEFESKFWVKNMRKLLDSDPDYYRPTSLGFAAKNLIAKGISSDADYQANFLNYPFKVVRDTYMDLFRGNDESRYFEILKSMDVLIKPGTLTVVLGRPGAGCSTFLKTVAAQTYGFKVDDSSIISYDGLTPKEINKNYRGEVIFSAEMDNHFPHLSVGQTLEFAAKMRTPQNRFPGVSRNEYAKHMSEVYMATYGLSHTVNTKVGDNFIRGVSGGERKRVSIAEASLCGANLQCWDNATRGLDAATALEFVRALKTSAHILDTTPLIAIYQCSQDAYDLFDNVVLLYEGYQIYFGPGDRAKDFFERMGYECPDRQTTADFLTSITSPAERVAKKGWENKVPQTPKEFNDYWRASAEYKELVADIDEYLSHCHNNNTREEFAEAHAIKQANHARPSSSFRVSYWMQIKLIAQRNIWRTKGDPSIMMFSVIANIIMGLIISSLFYNLSATTGTFYYRSAAMFFAVLFNAFSSLLEVMSLFESRPIVEKHKMFALYHPSADAFASIFTELPAKIATSLGFNLMFYFMVNFRRNPGRFFFYLLMNFMATLVMSHIFRSIGSCFKTLSESMPPATVFLTAMVIYTGFALPTPSMHGWSRWINYLDPVAYVFEALMANEFDGRRFECSQFIPSYPNADLANQVCSVVASVPGFSYVNGTDYIYESYRYKITHKWRNFGIVVGFIIFFLFVYVTLVELNKGAMQKGEIILFQQSKLREMRKEKKSKQISDIEGGSEKPAGVYDHGNEDSEDGVNNLTVGSDIFHWRDVCYEVQIKDETRRILNHVDGWVKPGTLTALMGASGAGKTTLLDVLANRVTMGVVSGSMFVNGRLRDQSFQRSTGYVQQQDLHLQTSTVREALRFSAYLRQSRTISKKEKDEYVESIIDILEMRSYADAVVGVAGEGLNVEQRKRLTIGVELAAKPKLLLFLDEPTSGLDSQTAWSVCQLMRKLADHGQAILCTIHQPSALLLKEFDRLLFLAKGGRTVYFGDLGENCQTLINYFESHGAHPCPAEANPAEWMLEVIGAAPGSHANQDYHEVWMSSDERRAVQEELHRMETELLQIPVDDSAEAKRSFASSYLIQYICVTKRVLQQYYRTPQYIWSKLFLAGANSIFNGFSFYRAGTSLQGLQNQMLSIFMLSVMLNTLVQQMLPLYITQRSIYEVRERPSKTFSWWVFLAAQVTAEFPWNLICGTISYFCWYYPIGLQNNASVTHTTAERGALTWLLIVGFFNYASSLGLMCIAGVEQEQNGANISNLLFTMCLNFCGILKYPTGFWKFMYRANPFTFWIASVLGAGVGDTPLVCSSKEIVYFAPPKGETCTTYIQPYIDEAGGYLVDSEREGYCGFCTASNTNAYLKSVHVEYSKRWQNWGIFICFIAINNIFMFLFYWLARVPKKDNRVKDASALKSDEKATLGPQTTSEA
uniref:ATP binding cassette transporter Abc1p n=1 Tax=Pichia kudriavzevii TaxID=4909 RepID=B8XW15_PICKU|nr:ATP binding cassette transporter Abc1p [Pichia kudriavzevii]